MKNKAIGGFFELEFPTASRALYPDAKEFQSARAAFLGLLRTGKPQRVWVPYYTCRTMLDSLRQADIEPAFYRIDDCFRMDDDVRIGTDDWFVYVNYFGVCTRYAESIVDRFDRNRVVIDCAQAMFAPPLGCLATVYSPRKFLGVPDGGWLITSLPVEQPEDIDDGSYDRSLSLLKRCAFSPEEAYAAHHSAEMTLFDSEPMRMSALTRRILSGIDYEEVRRIRNRNFAYLHAALKHHNLLDLDAGDVNGALCYPLRTRHSGLKKFLIEERIFVPTYWNDVLDLVSPSSLEARLVQEIVPLPCDQRYGEDDMDRVVATCLKFFANR